MNSLRSAIIKFWSTDRPWPPIGKDVPRAARIDLDDRRALADFEFEARQDAGCLVLKFLGQSPCAIGVVADQLGEQDGRRAAKVGALALVEKHVAPALDQLQGNERPRLRMGGLRSGTSSAGARA